MHVVAVGMGVQQAEAGHNHQQACKMVASIIVVLAQKITYIHHHPPV